MLPIRMSPSKPRMCYLNADGVDRIEAESELRFCTATTRPDPASALLATLFAMVHGIAIMTVLLDSTNWFRTAPAYNTGLLGQPPPPDPSPGKCARSIQIIKAL
jgi:hypothetical protein